MPVEKLTDRRVKTVRADGKPLELRDQLVRGLELRVMTSGHKSWALRYRRTCDRKKRTLKLGVYPSLSLNAARNLARENLVRVAGGEDPADTTQLYKAAPAFRGVAEEWLLWKVQQNRSKSYIARSRERLEKDVYPIIGDKKACDVSKRDVAAIVERAGARGAHTEANRLRALLHAILKWAAGTGRIDSNPAENLPRPFGEKPRERVLSDDEIRAIWSNLDCAPGDSATKIAMRLCLVLGQRPKEIVGLSKSHLDLEGAIPTLRIAASEAKNREGHIVPLSNLAVALFREALIYAGDSHWVFPSPRGGGPLSPHALTHIFSREKRKNAGNFLGVPDARLYDFKRTVATGLGEMGFPNDMIGRLLNHKGAKSQSITSKHYNHALYLRERHEMLNVWEERLRSILSMQEPKTKSVM